jgi:sulfopyruvate decarboxylase TPP-binding subunit
VTVDEKAVARSIHAGLLAGGVTVASYLPDSRFAVLEQMLEDDPRIETVRCAREDEGVAIAMGAAMGGAQAVAIMEGTGLGLSGLILARAKVQHTPLLLLVSHTAGPGESRSFHSTAIAASRAILTGLDIPCFPLSVVDQIEDTVTQTLVTVRAQRTVYALALPGLVHGGTGGDR